MSTFRGHWPNQVPVIFGAIASFSFVLYVLLYPPKSFDSSAICLVLSMLGFFYFIKRIL